MIKELIATALLSVSVGAPLETIDSPFMASQDVYVQKEYPTNQVESNDDLIVGNYYRFSLVNNNGEYWSDYFGLDSNLSDIKVYGYYIVLDYTEIDISDMYYIYFNYDYNLVIGDFTLSDDIVGLCYFIDNGLSYDYFFVVNFLVIQDAYFVIQYDEIFSRYDYVQGYYTFFSPIQDGDIAHPEYVLKDNGDTLFDSMFNYFHDSVFNSEILDAMEFQFFGATTSMRTYLCMSASLITLITIVVLCFGFILMLVKFVGSLFVNLGR